MNNDFVRNSKKFFGQEATPNTLQQEFGKNAEKFFYNSEKAPQVYFVQPGSIHKPKKQKNFVDLASEAYQKDAKNFFNANTPAVSNRSNDVVDPEFQHASDKSFSKPHSQTDKNSRKNESDYKFSLSRAEIAKPEGGFLNKTNNPSRNSQRKSLSAVGKQYISS